MKKMMSILLSVIMISSIHIVALSEGEDFTKTTEEACIKNETLNDAADMSVDVIPLETEIPIEDQTVNMDTLDMEMVDTESAVTDSWSEENPLLTGRAKFYTLNINGDIYVVGGNDDSGYNNTIEKYNEVTDSWEVVTTIPIETYGFTAVEADTKIYIIGGYLDNVYLNNVQIYDTQTNEWLTSAPMLERREEAASLYVDNKIYVFGGRNVNGIVNNYEYYDISNNTWNKVTSGYDDTLIRVGAKAKYVNGYVCIYGGYNNLCESMGVNLYLSSDMSNVADIVGQGKAHISIAWGTNKGLIFLADEMSSSYLIYEMFVENENPYIEQITDITVPCAMYYSEAAIHDGYLYFIGGYDNINKCYNSSVHKYSVYYGDYSIGDGQISDSVTADGNTITLNVDAGKEYMFMINVNNMTTFDGYTFTIDYPYDSFYLVDGCALTPERNTGAGINIQGTDVRITESENDGMSFICTESIPSGKSVSETVNAVVLCANTSGQRTITFRMTK